MKSISKIELSFYISIFMTTIAKSLPHAILTILLYSKGLTISNILIMQSVFNFVILISELPSGILSDIYSKKSVYLTSNIALCLMYLVILLQRGFFWMTIAWVLYGISEALFSGIIDASVINKLKTRENAESHVIKFKKIGNQLSMIAMILGGTIGSFAYFIVGDKLYVLAFVLVLLATLNIFFNFPSDKQLQNVPRISPLKQIRDGITELAGDTRLVFLVGLSLVGQIFFQTHFQIWQAYILFIGFPKKSLFVFYLIFQVIGFAAYAIPIRRHFMKLLIAVAIVSAVLPIIVAFSTIWVSLAAYMLFVFIFMFLDYMYDVLYALTISQERISTLISFNSSISRIGSFAILAVNGILLEQIDIKSVVGLNFEISIILSIFIGLFCLRAVKATKEKEVE
ncbi:MFS transporter [Lacticaseibacillus paracasei]|uniref:MFS transporter n=1 Tax=Lacticaseibacillus paracasei TaxID=1597 RepID=UPI0021D034B1|nr:MFS transporter [Lacticaseibacillus paracasei]MCU6430014.1 MFS transporter [Lacticaseibacillus paracasei]